jgi:transcriptional regulator with XRE-family HTH domain
MAMKYGPDERLFLKSIGNNIRNFRKKRGISQEELANLAGIDRSYLGSVERGERNVSSINLKKISLALSVPPAQLLRNT